jgi:arylsulfatase A-like enzyme
MRSFSDGRWKLIRYPLVDRTQLFDLEKDPRELTNLADQPAHAETLRRLQERLGAEMKAYDDAFPLSVANPAPAEWTPPSKARLAAEDAKAKGGRKKKTADPAKK